MFCIKCGKEISDESLFCNFCGSKVAQISDNAENNTVLNETIKNISENESVQKAKNMAADATKVIGAGLTSAGEAVKNSNTYSKIMSNEQVQKVSGKFKKLNKKTRIVIVAVIIILIILFISSLFGGDSGGSTVKIGDDGLFGSSDCLHECKAGRVGFDSTIGGDESGQLYFMGKNPEDVYLIKAEDGSLVECTGTDRQFNDKPYDAKLWGIDKDGDGYVDFTISRYNGSEYVELCVIKANPKEKSKNE